MQSPPASVGIGRILKVSRRVLGRLKGHPKAKALVPKLQVPHSVLKKANVALTDADDVCQDTGGAVDVCDVLGRETLTDFQIALVGVVRRDYKSPEYLAFFADGFETIKRKSGAELQVALKGIADHILTLAKDSPLQVHVKPLVAASDAFVAPLKADGIAKAALDQADKNLAAARALWLLAYDGLYGDVRSMFPKRKAFVESFFPEWSKKAEKGEQK